MKQIGKYFVEDNFEYEADEAFGVTLYRASLPVKGKSLFADVEQMAYEYAVSQVCETCGMQTNDKYHFKCDSCTNINNQTKFESLPEVESSNTFVYSDMLDEYFSDHEIMWERITDHISEYNDFDIDDITLECFKLHTCKEMHPSPVDIDSCFEDAYEDFSMSNLSNLREIEETVNKLNELLSKEVIGYKPVMSSKMKITDVMREELEEVKKQIIIDWREEYECPQY